MANVFSNLSNDQIVAAFRAAASARHAHNYDANVVVEVARNKGALQGIDGVTADQVEAAQEILSYGGKFELESQLRRLSKSAS